MWGVIQETRADPQSKDHHKRALSSLGCGRKGALQKNETEKKAGKAAVINLIKILTLHDALRNKERDTQDLPLM